MNKLFILSAAVFALLFTACEKDTSENATKNSKDRIVLNDSQILYHYYAQYSRDTNGVEHLWEEDFYEYDNQNRLSKKVRYYYDPNGVLYDTTNFIYTYTGNKVIVNEYNNNNINYARNIYVLNSNNLIIIDSAFQKGFFSTPQFFNEKEYEYLNKKLSRQFSKNSPNQDLYFWTNGNLSKIERYNNGALNQTKVLGNYSTLLNKNYCGDFFYHGQRNRNWISSEDGNNPNIAKHNYISDSNGFVIEDLLTISDNNGKVLRYFKEIYK